MDLRKQAFEDMRSMIIEVDTGDVFVLCRALDLARNAASYMINSKELYAVANDYFLTLHYWEVGTHRAATRSIEHIANEQCKNDTYTGCLFFLLAMIGYRMEELPMRVIHIDELARSGCTCDSCIAYRNSQHKEPN